MTRYSYLSTTAFARLNHACMLVTEGMGKHAYLVGSATERADFRDVDVRLILEDEEFDRRFGSGDGADEAFWGLFCLAVSSYLSTVSGLPVDFQVQRMTEANQKFAKPRNPIGTKGRTFAGGGDWR